MASAAVNSFLDWGWEPTSPVKLTSPEGVTFQWDVLDPDAGSMSCKALTRDLRESVARSIRNALWKEAGASARGGGLATGVDWKIPLLLLRRNLADARWSGMARCILTDAFVTPAIRWRWAVEKATAAGTAPEDDGSFLCPHGCGASKAAVDHLHLFWTCSKLPGHEAPEVTDSQNLLRPAVRFTRRGQSALWLRGLTPIEKTHGLIPERLDGLQTHGDRDWAAQALATIFTDGSGGKWSADARLRTATFGYVAATFVFGAAARARPHHPAGYRLLGDEGGWLVVPSSAPSTFATECLKKLVDFKLRTGIIATGVVYRAAFGILGGTDQTVPAAELAALTFSLQEERPGHPCLVVTDHANHVSGWRKGRQATLESALVERWRDFWRAVESHPEVRLLWTRSHRESTLAGDLLRGRSPEAVALPRKCVRRHRGGCQGR